jgi:hypothetical protein
MEFFRKLRSYLKGNDPSTTVVERSGGPQIIFDQEMIEYLNSKAPQPTQHSLDKMLENARIVRIIEGGVSRGQALGKTVLLENSDATTLTGLRQILQIVDEPGGHCMCHGNPALEFLDNSGKRLALISLHHGHGIRWDAWKDDARLVDGLKLLEWLAARGVQYPLQDYEAARQRGAVEEAAWKRWFDAMPACLQPLLTDQRQHIGMVLFAPLSSGRARKPQPVKLTHPPTIDTDGLVRVKQALETAYPDVVQRARVLFLWFGEGAGPWSGFPPYEQIVEYLLMDVPIDDVLRALDDASLPRPLFEGAARFLAGSLFAVHRAIELDRLPLQLRQRLLEFSLDTNDTDKQERAKLAFQRLPPEETLPLPFGSPS